MSELEMPQPFKAYRYVPSGMTSELEKALRSGEAAFPLAYAQWMLDLQERRKNRKENA